MALPTVNIKITNGNLGLSGAVTGFFALVGTLDNPSSLPIGTPALITSAADAETTHGISTGSNFYRHISDFYLSAPQGTPLYILPLARTVSMKDICDPAQANYARKLIDYANGAVGMVSVCREPEESYEPTPGGGMDKDVLDATLNAQALAESYAAQYRYMRVLIEARDYANDPATLEDLKTHGENRAGVVLGTTMPNGSGSVGLALGKFASNPVQRNIGRVKDGTLNIDNAYVGSSNVDSMPPSILAAVHDKGYMFMRSYPGVSGYYFNDDPAATKNTDDYVSLARGRVMDKACAIAYATYVEELMEEVPVTLEGKLDPGVVRYLESKLERQIELQMVGEISSVSVTIDPAQDIIATGKTVTKVAVTPIGYNKQIEIEIGYSNPNNV